MDNRMPSIAPPLQPPLSGSTKILCYTAAALVPLAYLFLYSPYGMDTTDIGYFYGFPWRLLQGEFPYRDFYYINPPVAISWHALWMFLTPETWNVLAGRAGFLLEMLLTSWLTTLYLNRVFALERLGLPLSLLATTGFVFAVHSFPHMPWHTIDGIFFSSVALYAGISGHPFIAGFFAVLPSLCKQSFTLVPLGLALSFWFLRPRKREVIFFISAAGLTFLAYRLILQQAGAWDAFVFMTTAPLNFSEALDSGIFIYLRQPWWIPALAALPFLGLRLAKKDVPDWLQPIPVYLFLLAMRYIVKTHMEQRWIGYGESWPMFCVILGGLCLLFPRRNLLPWLRDTESPHPLLRCVAGLGAPLLVAWSVGISGGYKVPAFFAVPLIFALLVLHARLGGRPLRAAVTALVLGLVMFRAGYEYPYVFPSRPMPRASLTFNAGDIFPKASGIYVDKEMYEELRELRLLRERYGPGYKTMPGFTMAYYLTGDKPAFPADWLMDWSISNQPDKLYQILLEKDLTVFMEKDQMDMEQADGYERNRYTIPQRVRKTWTVIDETPHFLVMRKP